MISARRNMPIKLPAAAIRVTKRAGQTQYSLVFVGYITCCIIAIAFAHVTERQFLGDIEIDGYTNQVVYIWNYFDIGGSLLDLEPIYWIHSVRAIIAYFFTSIEDIGGGGLVAAVLMVLAYPIAKVFFWLRRGYLILALPLISMAISERAFLVIIAVGYILSFIRGGNTFYFLFVSFILSNLSSGSVMNNLIISSTLARNHRPYSLGLYIYIALQTISLIISAQDKYLGFSEQRSGYNATVYGASGIEAIISRSTIFVSLLDGNYLRFAAYSSLGVIAAGLMLFALRSKQYRGYVLILVSVIPALIFEGLGFLSLLVPMLLFLAGEPMPWRPEKKLV